MERIGIIGNGGQADEAESYLRDDAIVEFRAISKEYVDIENPQHINVVTPTEYQKMLPVVAAIGSPETRRKMVEEWPGEYFAVIRAETSYIDSSTLIGEGSIIGPRSVITTNVEIGKHAIINVAATISHDSKIGNYVTVSPGAHIAGNVELGDGVFVGIGAVISNNLRIAKGVVVGAGAVVTSNIETENAVVVGTPAKIIKVNEGWLREI